MTTKTQRPAIDTYKKEYVYVVGEYMTQDGEYRHHYINFLHVGQQYAEGRYYSSKMFQMMFQVSLKPESDGHITNEGRAYGGRIEDLAIRDMADAHKILQDAQRQVTRLEIGTGDAYRDMLTALRAAGYRRGITHDSHITDIE